MPRRENVRVKGVMIDSEWGRRAENARLRDVMGALKWPFLVGVLGADRTSSGDDRAFAGVGGMILKSGGCGGSRGFLSGEFESSLGGDS